MKRTATKSLILVAVMAAATLTASAESLKVEIPFTFHAGGAVMASGSYTINRLSSNGPVVLRLTNNETSNGILMISHYRPDASREWVAAGQPRLSFQCAGKLCQLTTIWTPGERTAMNVGAPLSRKALAEIRVITLSATKAD
jgi:hypothetical protein